MRGWTIWESTKNLPAKVPEKGIKNCSINTRGYKNATKRGPLKISELDFQKIYSTPPRVVSDHSLRIYLNKN